MYFRIKQMFKKKLGCGKALFKSGYCEFKEVDQKTQ